MVAFPFPAFQGINEGAPIEQALRQLSQPEGSQFAPLVGGSQGDHPGQVSRTFQGLGAGAAEKSAQTVADQNRRVVWEAFAHLGKQLLQPLHQSRKGLIPAAIPQEIDIGETCSSAATVGTESRH